MIFHNLVFVIRGKICVLVQLETMILLLTVKICCRPYPINQIIWKPIPRCNIFGNRQSSPYKLVAAVWFLSYINLHKSLPFIYCWLTVACQQVHENCIACSMLHASHVRKSKKVQCWFFSSHRKSGEIWAAFTVACIFTSSKFFLSSG